MAKNKKGNLFSGKNGRRDWDEPEDNEYDDDEYEEAEEDEDDESSDRPSLFSSARKLFGSRRQDDDEYEDEEDEDDEEEEEPKRKRKGFALPRFRAGKKSEKADYDFDYDDGAEEGEEVFYDDPLAYDDYAPAEETYAEDGGYYEEAPEAYAEEGIAFDEDGAAYTEEYYAPEEYAVPEAQEYYVPEEFAESEEQEYYVPEETAEIAEEEYYAPEETAAAEEEDEYDPFAALSQRAANPAADESFYEYEEDEDYGEEDYDDFDDFDEEPKSTKRKHSGRSGGLLMPALSVIALCAVGAIAFATVTLLGSPKYENAKAKATEAPKAETTVVETEQPQNEDDLSETERQAMGLATPVPGTEENQVKAKLDSDGRIVPDVGGSVVPIRSVKRSNDDFAGSAMIGNSFVEGMNLWSEIESLKYICADGVNLDNMIGNYLYYVTVQNYDSIYLCLGLNEIGWSADTFISKYEKVIDYIRSDGTSKTKNATIYVVSVMPVEEILETVPGESGATISLSTIREFNDRLKTMCQEKGCWYLDVYSALANDKGYLPESTAADDHIHFEKTGYRIWTDYMRNHYVDEKLLGE